jgi:lysophospholipase L1-like esterase
MSGVGASARSPRQPAAAAPRPQSLSPDSIDSSAADGSQGVRTVVNPRFARYVALGDSQTEGLNDGDDTNGYRGWADRLAENLARLNPDLRYANLAVRGRVISEIHAEQLQPALALRPDLVTVLGGMNDLLRPRFDATELAGHLEAMFAALTGAGARVVTLTLPDIGVIMPATRRLRPRLHALNAGIRAAASRHGVAVVDAEPYPITADRRIWSPDRLHANAVGHARIAAAVAHALDLPGSDPSWMLPLDPLPRQGHWQATRAELVWVRTFVLPWLVRRLRGRSSGDGRVAKRPGLEPIRPESAG